MYLNKCNRETFEERKFVIFSTVHTIRILKKILTPSKVIMTMVIKKRPLLIWFYKKKMLMDEQRKKNVWCGSRKGRTRSWVVISLITLFCIKYTIHEASLSCQQNLFSNLKYFIECFQSEYYLRQTTFNKHAMHNHNC